jgi:hypothetical protein
VSWQLICEAQEFRNQFGSMEAGMPAPPPNTWRQDVRTGRTLFPGLQQLTDVVSADQWVINGLQKKILCHPAQGAFDRGGLPFLWGLIDHDVQPVLERRFLREASSPLGRDHHDNSVQTRGHEATHADFVCRSPPKIGKSLGGSKTPTLSGCKQNGEHALAPKTRASG